MEHFYRARHRCIRCGSDLTPHERSKQMVMCTTCQAKARQERERPQLTTKAQERLEKCRACEFARLHDGMVFCPSAKGTCIKKELKAREDAVAAAGDDCVDDSEDEVMDE